MSLKPWIGGAVAALMLTVPVMAASAGGAGAPAVTLSNGVQDLGDVHEVIEVAALASRPTPGQTSVGTTAGDDRSTDPLPVAVVPMDPIKIRPRHVAHVVHLVPVVATEEVANATFRTDRLWVIGSFR
jgi:hypothetical protein